MKNFLILLLTALLLFAIAAALSLWLQQSALTAAAAQNDKEKNGKQTLSTAEEPPRPPPAKTEPPPAPTPPAASELASAWNALREREAQFERRLQQVQIVLRDLQEERERFDALVRQLTNEAKTLSKRLDQLSTLEAEAKKKPATTEDNDRKNIDRLAAMFDTMEASAAAAIVKQMADSGKMELAARILAQMKERNAARILSEIDDSALATQIIERVRGIKYPNSGPAPVVVPVNGTEAAPR